MLECSVLVLSFSELRGKSFKWCQFDVNHLPNVKGWRLDDTVLTLDFCLS
jgi:hypothetical protein